MSVAFEAEDVDFCLSLYIDVQMTRSRFHHARVCVSSVSNFYVNHTSVNLSYYTNGAVIVIVTVGDADGITNLEMVWTVVKYIVVREL